MLLKPYGINFFLRTELKTIGSSHIQPGIFAHASLNIPKNIYKVKDFACDFVTQN